MSETPERKVLKEMIEKLKTKVINSLNRTGTIQASVITRFLEALDKMNTEIQKLPMSQQPGGYLLMSLFGLAQQNVNLLVSNVNATFEDMMLYIDTLEKYSIELDKTLSNIFEKAKKMAEENRKKQEELMERKPTDQEIV